MKQISVIAMSAMALVVRAQTGHYSPYSVSKDFREVANLKTFASFVKLSPEQRSLLKKNLFVVTPKGDSQLFEVYATNDYRNLPSLITTDPVLHAYHVFFDGTLRKIEADALLPRLERLTAKMLAASERTAERATNPSMKAAAEKNAAFFWVAAELLHPGGPPNMLGSVEIERIKAAKGFERSEIFPYQVDYSRFIVRGHYTRSEALKRYFRAMAWYGVMPFALTDDSGHPLAEQIRMAVLATDTLRQTGEEGDWQAIYDPTALYVGLSNMTTPAEVRKVADATFGPSHAIRSDRLAAFVAGVRAVRMPRIQANVKERKGMPGSAVQFRFMGLRYIPDSEMLQKLTGPARPMATGLDVMAVLGSSRAANTVDSSPARYNPAHWPGYVANRAALENQFAQVPASTWMSNLYWSWLDAIRLVAKPVPAGYPQFMRGAAWQDKNLATALASWTELRHDTILYGEQSVSEMGDGDTPVPFVKGFVEPSPVYDRLLALSKQSRGELQRRKLIGQDAVAQFKAFENMLAFFSSVSRKELAGTRLTKAEHLRIRHIEGEFSDMSEMMLRYGTNFKALTQDDLDMALIADVHTAGDYALEEGVGHSDSLIAVVPIEGKLYLARGSVFSYYEFPVPISERMTDEAWKHSLADHKDHPRPHWTSSYFVPKQIEEKD